MKADDVPVAADRSGCNLESLSLYAAGELDADDRQRVGEHVVHCMGCWNDLQVSRAVTGAVQQLWEPAPPALRADLRAAVGRATTAAPRPRFVRLAVAVAASVALVGGGIGAVLLNRSSPTPVVNPTAASGIPARVEAAAQRFGTAGTGPAPAAAGPSLTGLGLRLESASTLVVADEAVARYTYVGPAGARVEVLVSARPWPRPTGAASVGASSWASASKHLTLVGGADRADDQMLLLATDHTEAMMAAAQLGVI